MRKRLMSLMVVLGVVSAATATPYISGPSVVGLGRPYTYSVVGTLDDADTDGGVGGDGGFSGVIWVDYPDYIYAISNVSSPTTAMGGLASIDTTTYLTSGGGVPFEAKGDSPWSESTDVDVGVWFTFDFSIPAGGPSIVDTWTIELLDSNFAPLSSFVVAIVPVPEPMTVVLLGIGGLFLRRRR